MFNYPENMEGCVAESTPSPITVMVPDFIVRAIKLHKLNAIDIPNYDLVSKVCSKDDLALWAALNEQTYKKVRFTDSVSYMLTTNSTNFPWSEFSTVERLASTEEVINASKEYMYTPTEEKTPFYELKSIGRIILVVVQPGFLYHLEKSDTVALDFIRELIKARESASSQSLAANSEIYKTFLKLTTSITN